jgi:hypothetical protein
MREWKWNGARWWRFDFHTHTPASDDYGSGANQAARKNRTPKEWLLDFMRAGIDCVAITDHNTGVWIDQLKKALAELETERPHGFRAIYLFPGMEISVHGGIHVLAIFDVSQSTADMDALRGAVEYAGTPGRSNGVTLKSFVEVVRTIKTAGGMAIPSHLDEDNGLFSQQGTTFQQALDSECIFAMELINPAIAKPQIYLDSKSNWTEVVGSDAHHPSGEPGQRFPGSHFTWVKMGEPCLEGLRLALLDGALSIRRSDQQTGDPNTHASSVIESIEVTNARYMGRSEPFQAAFNPWLNAVIGGRGTGKSTLVEFLRTALRRTGELPEALSPDFEKYARVYQSREDNGLLTSDSCFAVVYRKDATRYRVQWSERADVPPIEVETEAGVWALEQGDVGQRFPVRIYSQKQIFELAKAPLALLRIVDEAPEVDRRGWQERWRELETRFLSLRAKAREIDAGLSEEGQLRGELEDIKRKLTVFEQAGHADILKNYQRGVRQQRLVQTWEESWATGGDRIRGIARDLVPDPLDLKAGKEEVDEADLLIRDKASVALEGITRVREKLEALAQEFDRLVAEWRKEREQSPWQRAIKSSIAAYEDLREQLAEKGAGDPSAYGELVQRRQSIETRLQAFEARRKEAESVRQQAGTCLKQLVELRRELTKRRTDFLSKVLEGNPYVRVDVLPYGARETIELEFRRHIQREGGGFERDIGGTAGQDGILGCLYSGAADSTRIEDRLAELKVSVRTIAGGSYDPDMVRDQRFATHLAKLPPETFDRLDAWFPEDTLQVDYSTTAGGSSFRSIQEGSPGQKTAALLAFLLSYGDEPIVLDQPEDDLDNRLIYDLIVTQLRNIKRRRQVIVVTHNANIVVNGDAEFVMAMAARGGQTQKECAGSLQEKNVRDTICAVMEGGREAFEQRYRRIALETRHV